MLSFIKHGRNRCNSGRLVTNRTVHIDGYTTYQYSSTHGWLGCWQKKNRIEPRGEHDELKAGPEAMGGELAATDWRPCLLLVRRAGSIPCGVAAVDWPTGKTPTAATRQPGALWILLASISEQLRCSRGRYATGRRSPEAMWT